MPRYQVAIVEEIQRTYVVEVETTGDHEEAASLAEDLLVNFEECRETNLEDERQISQTAVATLIDWHPTE